jgi:hypothetical protein
MAEISKEMKIVLIINMFVALLYGITHLLFPEGIHSLDDAPYFDPHFWRLFGGALTAIGIAFLLGIINGEWNNIKILFQFAIIYLIVIALVNFTSNLYATRSATNEIFHLLDIIVTLVLLIIDIIFYQREVKKK